MRRKSTFNDIMSPEEQERWLADLDYVDISGRRIVDPTLRGKYASKYEWFTSMPEAAEVTRVLREYVRTGVPAIRPGEGTYWICSCLPHSRGRQFGVYSRISVNWQEVFAVYRDDDEPAFSWLVALSPLEGAFGPSLSALAAQHPGLEYDDESVFVPGGEDQIRLAIQGYQPALRVIHDPRILKAVRQFNLDLMRRGAGPFARYHCPELAEHLVT